MKNLHCVGPLLFLLPLLAVVTRATPPPAFEVLPGQRILFKGDSIVRGFAFGNFTHPSKLRTLHGIANLLVADNLPARPPVAALPHIWQGLNSDGTPKTVDTLGAELRVNAVNGDLRPGDWLIYEDAGPLDSLVMPAPWPDTKNMYGRHREALRTLVREADLTIGRDHVFFMTMFDYDPIKPWCQWDVPLDDGLHSGNDAVRDEAAALGVRVIDMKRIMDQASNYVTKAGWGRMVGPDGIHPNVLGNYVMVLAVMGSLGADVGRWKLDALERHFLHPAAGGDVANIWGFSKDPTDAERKIILRDLQKIVAEQVRAAASGLALTVATPPADLASRGAHTYARLLRHGRLLGQAVRQPANTTRPISYEVGTILQLDREHAVLIASLREEGGHDFCVGNDAFVFEHLADIVPERALPINRLEVNRPLKSGKGTCILGKFPASGAFVPLGAKMADGSPHPAAGTGFLVSGTLPFLPDRSLGHPDAGPDDRPFDLIQLKWDGKELKVTQITQVHDLIGRRIGRMGLSNFCAQDSGFLCPFGPIDGSFVVVVRFDWDGDAWTPTQAGQPFITAQQQAWRGGAADSTWNTTSPKAGTGAGAAPRDKPLTEDEKKVTPGQPLPTNVYRYLEVESSIVHVGSRYVIHTRGVDAKGRVYTSADGLNYTFAFDHHNERTPQVLNEGLDGSLYLATNASPGRIRNPLFAYAVSLEHREVKDPLMVHDDKFVHASGGAEHPFIDHARASNIYFGGRWRHLLLYRVCDLRETNGQGMPAKPQSGLYLAEFEYPKTTVKPHLF